MKIDEKLSEVFDIEPMHNAEVLDSNGGVVAPINPSKEKIETDYDAIRGNLYSILNQGQEALIHALEVAKQSEHPRAFEVVGNLMKNLSDINHQIIDLHTKRSKLETKVADEATVTKTVTNNSIFVGSTADLTKMIENMKRGE